LSWEFPKNQKLNLLKKYRDFLKSLRILDPAVGSGAFLNEAFDYLKNEYQFISDSLSNLSLKQKNIFFTDNFDSLILEHNLFGVDINRSAIEIAKLSLWLKTAQKGRKLKNLSNNLICANSLLDMPFENGSFDIVVGNPPYGAKLGNEKKEFEIKSGESAILFMQLAEKMLKKEGLHGFIIPKPFGTINFYIREPFSVSNLDMQQAKERIKLNMGRIADVSR